MSPSVFDYANPVEFLNANLLAVQAQNPSYSMRAWAKQLGLTHPAMLSMVLSGKRKLLPNLSSKISAQYRNTGKFSEVEARYFDMLVLFHLASTVEERNFYESILSSLKPDKKFHTLALDQLNVISDWYHSVITEMTFLKDFNSDPQWISLKLGGNVNPLQVQTAIERLIRLGLLERQKNKKLVKTNTHLSTTSDVPSRSLRKYHAEMITKAKDALEDQPVEQRDITSYTFAIEKRKIPEAKKMIRDFRRKLAAFLESPNGDSVYQLNIQLFDLLTEEKK